MNNENMPKFPTHPEHYMAWTPKEREAIEAYGQAGYNAGRDSERDTKCIEFGAWWERKIAENGGVFIGADYRHWAEQAWIDSTIPAGMMLVPVEVPEEHSEHEECNCQAVGYANGWNAACAAAQSQPAVKPVQSSIGDDADFNYLLNVVVHADTPAKWAR